MWTTRSAIAFARRSLRARRSIDRRRVDVDVVPRAGGVVDEFATRHRRPKARGRASVIDDARAFARAIFFRKNIAEPRSRARAGRPRGRVSVGGYVTSPHSWEPTPRVGSVREIFIHPARAREREIFLGFLDFLARDRDGWSVGLGWSVTWSVSRLVVLDDDLDLATRARRRERTLAGVVVRVR